MRLGSSTPIDAAFSAAGFRFRAPCRAGLGRLPRFVLRVVAVAFPARRRRSHVRNRTDTTRSGNNRSTHMSPQLQGTLRALYLQRFNKVRALDAEQQAALEATQTNEAAAALIFTNGEGRHLNNRNFHRDVWQLLLTVAKLSHHTIKDLRHTAGTLLAERVALPHYVTRKCSGTLTSRSP
jgi:hypothetical protein